MEPSKHEDGTISPSRMDTYIGCALRYKYQYIDGRADPAGIPAIRGNIVHRFLEAYYKNPTSGPPIEDLILGEENAVVDEYGRSLLYQEVDRLLGNYLCMEDVREVIGRAKEMEYPIELDLGVVKLRGIIDRVDATPTGTVLVDYKTGKPPSEAEETRKMSGLLAYALMWWRQTGELPTVKLLYLKSKLTITRKPDEATLEAFERKVLAAYEGMQSGTYEPQVSFRCGFCPHRSVCPGYIEAQLEKKKVEAA